jgi:hypothetical protein
MAVNPNEARDTSLVPVEDHFKIENQVIQK